MRIRWATLLVIAMTAGPATGTAAAASTEDVFGAIDECIGRLDADPQAVLQIITTHCPDLPRLLQASNWAAWLPAGWQDGYSRQAAGWQGNYDHLSARTLAALRTVVARELALRTDARSPHVAVLRPILAELAVRNPPPRAWWERLRSWLRALFAPEPKSGANWFERFSGRVSVSEALIRLVAYATFALVVILGAYIVVNEWRASGPQRRRTGGRFASAQAQQLPIRPSSWHDVERAAPNEQPRVLLELIAARLTAARRLPASRTLTVRELTRAAELTDAADRERLDELALTSERLRFAHAAPTAAGVARVLARGRGLFDRLGEALAARS
jgi:hypothetical protein